MKIYILAISLHKCKILDPVLHLDSFLRITGDERMVLIGIARGNGSGRITMSTGLICEAGRRRGR